MFLIFGRKTKYRPIEGSRRIRRRCPECSQEAEILECERLHTYEAYFVSLFDTSSTVWVCSACKEEVELPDALLPGDDAERKRKAIESAEQARAAQRRQLADKAEAIKSKVEDELAAMKARLRRQK